MSDAPPASERISPFAVFRRREFRYLWTAQLVSTAGSALTDLAAGILVFRATGSALAVGLTLMVTAVPSLIVGLIAGVFVDRFDRKRIMVASNAIQAILVAAIPFAIGVNIAFLFAILLTNAAVKQFFDPAHDSLIPDIAPDEELAAANSFISIAAFGSTAIGFAGAGLLASAFDLSWAFWIDALTFVFSAFCVSRLRTSASPTPEDATSVGVVLANLREGIRTLLGTPVLRSVFLVGVPMFFAFGLWNVLLLPFAVRPLADGGLGASEFEYGLQEGLTSVGFVAGSLVMARFAQVLREGTWMVVGTLGMGIAGLLYGNAQSIPLAIGLVMISGLFNSPVSVSRAVLLQRNTPREMRGRVFSAVYVMRDVVFLLGMAAAGLADVVPIRLLIVTASLVLVALAAVTLVAPGVGRPAAEWRQAVQRLRSAPAVPLVALPGRPATLDDFDRLAARLATFGRLGQADRTAFLEGATVRHVEPGAMLVRHGEPGASAFFILDGVVHAGVPTSSGYRDLTTMTAGDFFGEIAALTGAPRTADVVSDAPTTLLEVPAAGLRSIMSDPQISQLVLSTLTERLVRTSDADLPRLAGLDQASLRELRAAPAPAVQPLPRTYAET